MKYEGFHIRKNDLVEVLAGKEKGKTGKVLQVFHKKDRVLVEILHDPFHQADEVSSEQIRKSILRHVPGAKLCQPVENFDWERSGSILNDRLFD